MEINKETMSLAKEDESSRNVFVANIEVIPEVEKAAVSLDVFTKTKPRTSECGSDVNDENTYSDSFSDEGIQLALYTKASVRARVNTCHSIVSNVADIVFEGLTKYERIIEIIDRVQHAERANLIVATIKYFTSVQILVNKCYKAEKVAEIANAQARRAEKLADRLFTLKVERLSHAEEAKFDTRVVKTAIRLLTTNARKIADHSVEAANEVWHEIRNIRNLEASLTELVERINRIADHSILYTFILFLSCFIAAAAAAINACLKFDIFSLYITSVTGCLLLLVGAAVSLVTGVYYRTDEEHSDLKKISNALEILKKSVHRLNKDLKSNKSLNC